MNRTLRRNKLGVLAKMAIASLAATALAGSTAAIAPVSANSTDGALDATFNAGQTGADKEIQAMDFASDGKIYIAGDFTSYNGTAVGGIARLNADGSLDTSFTARFAHTTPTSLRITSIDVAADGDVYATGSFTSVNGTAATENSVVRFNSDGTVDTGFDSPKFGRSGVSTPPQNSFVRVVNDTVFVSGSFDDVYIPATAGQATHLGSGLIALTTAGGLHPTFESGSTLAVRLKKGGAGGAVTRAYDLVPVPSSTDVYLLGNFDWVSSQLANQFIRLKNDGTRNLEYANDGSAPAVGPSAPSGVDLAAMAIQSDGKVILGGYFDKFNNEARNGIVRTASNGSLDSAFPSSTASISIESLAVDSDDRIYVSGFLGKAYSTLNANVARLNSDGTVDTSFSPVEFDNSNAKVAISPDGKVYAYGQFTRVGVVTPTNVGRIARISTTAKPKANTNATAGVPGQPTKIRAKITGTRAKVSWTAPTTGGAPTSYTATAVPAGPAKRSVNGESVTEQSSLSCTVAAPATSCTIRGLTLGMSYGFLVAASNAAGSSEFAPLPQPLSALPATGSSDQTWILLAIGLCMLGGGVVIRRRELL